VNDREHASDISSHHDAIAHVWDEELKDSSYGTEALMRAIQYCGIEQNILILQQHACRLRHLELDQFPLKHCTIIAQKQMNQ